MKLSNSVRRTSPPGPETPPRAKRKNRTQKPKPAPLNAPDSRPEHQTTNSLPSPPLREVPEAVDQGHNQPTRQSSGVAVGEPYLGQHPYPVKPFLKKSSPSRRQTPNGHKNFKPANRVAQTAGKTTGLAIVRGATSVAQKRIRAPPNDTHHRRSRVATNGSAQSGPRP